MIRFNHTWCPWKDLLSGREAALSSPLCTDQQKFLMKSNAQDSSITMPYSWFVHFSRQTYIMQLCLSRILKTVKPFLSILRSKEGLFFFSLLITHDLTHKSVYFSELIDNLSPIVIYSNEICHDLFWSLFILSSCKGSLTFYFVTNAQHLSAIFIFYLSIRLQNIPL